MQQGRKRNNQTHMKGSINQEKKLTDIYLPRKCDYTDKVIHPQDKSSIQLSICDVQQDGTIDLSKSTLITICGFVRSTGESDVALEKIMKQKNIL